MDKVLQIIVPIVIKCSNFVEVNGLNPFKTAERSYIRFVERRIADPRSRARMDHLERFIENCFYLYRLLCKKEFWDDLNRMIQMLIFFVLHFYTCFWTMNQEDENEGCIFGEVRMCCVVFHFLSSLWSLLWNDDLYVYRRHFTDFPQKTSYVIAYYSFMIYIMAIPLDVLSIYRLKGLVGFTISLCLNLVYRSISTQINTRLRFDPTSNNHKFRLDYSINNDNEKIKIISSSVYKIVLKNIGSEPWSSTEYQVLRSTNVPNAGMHFDLPSFTLLPEEQVELVPESCHYEGDCLRVPGLFCFGLYDVSYFVETRVLHKNEHWLLSQRDYFGIEFKAEAQLREFYENKGGSIPE